MIVHTIQRFEQCGRIDAIVVVIARDHKDLFDRIRRDAGFSKLAAVVPGSLTRAGSVRNGLAAVDPGTNIVAVHDGARPLVTVDEIDRTVAAAEDAGAACLVGPVTDTIKTVEGGSITGTLDRRDLRRALTPQAFSYELLKQAFEQGDIDEAVSDECYLVEKLGKPIAAVTGSSRNLKITHLEDLLFVEALLRAEADKKNV